MSNTLPTTQYVLNNYLVRLVNYLRLGKVAYRDLESEFGSLPYATGRSIDYKIQQRFQGGEGATATSEDIIQKIRTLTIDKQFHSMVQLTGFELTFDRAADQPYLDQRLGPQAQALANNIESYIARDLQKKSYLAVGTPGVSLDYDTLLDCRAYAGEMAIPDDDNRYLAVPYRQSAQLSRDLDGSFNKIINTGALIDGFIGRAAGLDIFESNFFTRQIAGAGEAGGVPPTGFKMGGTVTGGPIASGSSITLTGLVASDIVFREGDSIEIDEDDGVFMVNPLTRDPLSQRAQFVVTQDIMSDAGGNATVTVDPEIITTGAYKNISAPIPNGAQVFLADDHNVSMFFNYQGIVFAAPPITQLKGGVEVYTAYSDLYKLSMTYTAGGDIINYKQRDRVDILAGRKINPEFVIRVRS